MVVKYAVVDEKRVEVCCNGFYVFSRSHLDFCCFRMKNSRFIIFIIIILTVGALRRLC